MRNYWSCTKFADWIRGTSKPSSADGRGWRLWEESAKAAHPVRYWIAEEGLDYVQKFIDYIPSKIRAVRYYINNRWITRSHALTAHPRDIKPGNWRDVGNRFLPCLFNELVDFVEIETAWMTVVFSEEERKKYLVPWWRLRGIRGWRSREAGLAYLDWAASLTYSDDWVDPNDPNFGKPTRQALDAQEVKELYLWWTEVYPNRQDPHDASGWSEYCDSRRGNGLRFLEDDPNEDKEHVRKLLDATHTIEAAQEAEDEEMMIRLIRIRNALWT